MQSQFYTSDMWSFGNLANTFFHENVLLPGYLLQNTFTAHKRIPFLYYATKIDKRTFTFNILSCQNLNKYTIEEFQVYPIAKKKYSPQI